MSIIKCSICIVFVLLLHPFDSLAERRTVIAVKKDAQQWELKTQLPIPMHYAGYYASFENLSSFPILNKLVPGVEQEFEVDVRMEFKRFPESFLERSGKLYILYRLNIITILNKNDTPRSLSNP